MSAAVDYDKELAEDIGGLTHDPLGFVMYNWPWGVKGGPLANEAGPEDWQRELLESIGKGLKTGAIDVDGAIRLAVASGHGIGKSALVAWIIVWAMATCPDTRGVVTANTDMQLRTKTWAELAKWHRMGLVAHWFTLTATALYSTDPKHEKTWRIDAVPWSENRPEAFAGLHNQGRRILVVFDEASTVADTIWETTEGALTDKDTEIIWCVFGNPTRNTGRFRECFSGGRFAHRWNPRQIDSRTVGRANHAQATQWVDDYGEDSDFVRVRVRGVFPRAGSMQFIAGDLVEEAQKRAAESIPSDPVVIGVDPARFGDDRSVIYIRKGRDGRTFPPIIKREIDNMTLAGLVAELATKHSADAVCVDAGAGAGVIDRLRQLNVENVWEIPFGGKPEGWTQEGGLPLFHNRAAEMWGRMREWLKGGAIPNDPDITADLTSREYGYDAKNAIQLEKKEHMKERGLASPDIADALALTFAVAVQPRGPEGGSLRNRRITEEARARLRKYAK